MDKKEFIFDFDIIQKYHSDGFMINGFKDGKNLEKINSIMKDLLFNESPKDGFFWESKYQNTLDLRPNIFEYDDVFLDILFENNIPQMMKEFLSPDITLHHISLRKSLKGPSYMPWHRDSYFIDDELVGNLPPAHKIIFYPSFDGKKDKKLIICKGSNNCLFRTQPRETFISPGFSQYDLEILKMLPLVEYKSSENEYFMFNTAALHNVIPDERDEGSIRVFYHFSRKFQYDKNYSHKPVHSELNKIYEKRVLENE